MNILIKIDSAFGTCLKLKDPLMLIINSMQTLIFKRKICTLIDQQKNNKLVHLNLLLIGFISMW